MHVYVVIVDVIGLERMDPYPPKEKTRTKVTTLLEFAAATLHMLQYESK